MAKSDIQGLAVRSDAEASSTAWQVGLSFDVDLALVLTQMVKTCCEDAPHDIGIHLAREVARRGFIQTAKP